MPEAETNKRDKLQLIWWNLGWLHRVQLGNNYIKLNMFRIPVNLNAVDKTINNVKQI